MSCSRMFNLLRWAQQIINNNEIITIQFFVTLNEKSCKPKNSHLKAFNSGFDFFDAKRLKIKNLILLITYFNNYYYCDK